MRILESMGDSHALASVHIDVDDNSEFSFNLSTDEQDAAHEK